MASKPNLLTLLAVEFDQQVIDGGHGGHQYTSDEESGRNALKLTIEINTTPDEDQVENYDLNGYTDKTDVLGNGSLIRIGL